MLRHARTSPPRSPYRRGVSTIERGRPACGRWSLNRLPRNFFHSPFPFSRVPSLRKKSLDGGLTAAFLSSPVSRGGGGVSVGVDGGGISTGWAQCNVQLVVLYNIIQRETEHGHAHGQWDRRNNLRRAAGAVITSSHLRTVARRRVASRRDAARRDVVPVGGEERAVKIRKARARYADQVDECRARRRRRRRWW